MDKIGLWDKKWGTMNLSKKKSANLWGYYGTNYGDNIMLNVFLDFFKQNSISLNLIEYYNPLQSYSSSGIYIISMRTDWKTKFKRLKKISDGSLNIWGGGTIFTDYEGDGLFRLFILSRIFGGRFGYIGIGIDKLTKISRILKAKVLLYLCSMCVFREKSSLLYAQNELGIKKSSMYVAEDLVYIYLEQCIKNCRWLEVASCNRYILVTLRNLDGILGKKHAEEVTNTVLMYVIKLLKKMEIEQVCILPLDSNMDSEVAIYCYSFLKKYDIDVRLINARVMHVDAVTSYIKNASFHFSGRLHGSMVSEVLQTPTFTISYSKKIQYMYESFQKSNYSTINNFYINDAEIESEINKNSPIPGEYIFKKALQAQQNLTILKKYVDGNFFR